LWTVFNHFLRFVEPAEWTSGDEIDRVRTRFGKSMFGLTYYIFWITDPPTFHFQNQERKKMFDLQFTVFLHTDHKFPRGSFFSPNSMKSHKQTIVTGYFGHAV
jgi:hypothetical protein